MCRQGTRSLELTGSESSTSVSDASQLGRQRRLSIGEEKAKAELMMFKANVRTSVSSNVENWKHLSWEERLLLTKKHQDPDHPDLHPEKDKDACVDEEVKSRFRAIRRQFSEQEDLLSYCRTPDGVDDVRVDDVVGGSLKFIDASGTEFADGMIHEFEYPVTLEFQVKVRRRKIPPVIEPVIQPVIEERSCSKTKLDEAYAPCVGDHVLIIEGEHTGKTGWVGEEWIFKDEPSGSWWVKVDGEARKIIHHSAMQKASVFRESSEGKKSTDFPTASTCAPSDQSDSREMREEEQVDESPPTASRCKGWCTLFQCN